METKLAVANLDLIKQALLIRRVEQTLLDLFSKGSLNGTVHTCIGQELSAVAFAGQLDRAHGDFIFSNHRCHGHFLAYSGDYRSLLMELMGKQGGVCCGIGGSQHLCMDNFFSNGVQGGIMPVAAGYALANKLKGNQRIGIVFIGDGTLGEGVVYETLNIISKWRIPLLVVCENNGYAQSTSIETNLAGDILKRAEAFGIKTFQSSTEELNDIMPQAKASIDFVRNNQVPAFHLVNTYRLAPHSKGDDFRLSQEIDAYAKRDFLNRFEADNSREFGQLKEGIDALIERVIADAVHEGQADLEEYSKEEVFRASVDFKPLLDLKARQVDLINEFFDGQMKADRNLVFIGEDILSPYGGAFKVARNLSDKYQDRVFSAPISEAAIVGVSNGLALNGMKPYAEMMFGDFMTLCFDQIVNHASKFHHMYAHQKNCPLVVRAPMGARRGYGPTHSQTLDKFLVGIDNVKVVALNTLADPRAVYAQVHQEEHPVIVLENKTDYGRKVQAPLIANYLTEQSQEGYPCVRIRPVHGKADLTMVAYGGGAHIAIESLKMLFDELEMKAEVLVLTQIYPLNINPILTSLRQSGRLIVLEEGSPFAGLGSEILAQVMEKSDFPVKARRVAARPFPVPSAKALEDHVLPNAADIVRNAEEIL